MAGRALAALFSFSVLFTGVSAIVTNETIDDAEVGPFPPTSRRLATIGYYPPNNGYWGTQEGASSTMVTVANAAMASGATYTAASNFAGTTPRSIVIDFFGTSITAFFTLSNDFPTECDVTLDGAQMFELRHAAGSRAEKFSYQVPGVRYSNLAPSSHRLEIKVTPYNDSRLNYVNFDFAEFTFDTEDAEAFLQNSSARLGPSGDVGQPNQEETEGGNQTAAIVGGTIGGAAVLAAALLVIFFVRSRRLRGGQAHSSSDSSSMEEKVGMPRSLPPSQSGRQSVFPKWRTFGSFMVRSPNDSGPPTSGPSTTVAASSSFASQQQQQHPGRPDVDRHSMFSSMTTSTKAHPLYLHIGPDGNSQWLSSPSEVHRLNLNSTPPQPHRRYSDDRLDALGLHLNTIQTPKTPPQPISPGSASIAAAARELQPSHQYPMPDLPVDSSYHR